MVTCAVAELTSDFVLVIVASSRPSARLPAHLPACLLLALQHICCMCQPLQPRSALPHPPALQMWPQYFPCACVGPCTKDCPCAADANFCEKVGGQLVGACAGWRLGGRAASLVPGTPALLASRLPAALPA